MSSSDNDNSRQTDKCGHCGATENLLKCMRCSSAAYCSKKCQLADWPCHKIICKLSSKMASKTSPLDALGIMYKEAQKQGVPASRLVGTHAGYINTADKEMPAGVPQNFVFIHEASTKMAMLGEGKRMYGEREYIRLYDDLVAKEHEWMEFFKYFLNHNHAGDCAMVLECLARIYFDRGDYEACGQVLHMHAKVFQHCEKHVTRSGAEDGFIRFCTYTEYKTKKLMYEMNLILKQHMKSVPVFKELCQFEITHVPAKDQLFNKRWKKMYRKCKSLNKLSDAMILEVVKVHSLELGAVTVDSAHVQLHECGLCKKKETSCGEFMNCSRCKKVVYCGRECQKKHWKVHKSECKAASASGEK